VVSIDGRSMVPLLQDSASRTYRTDEPVGYEPAASLVLYKGDYKLAHTVAPVGDGAWHLCDLVRDPGEV